MLSPAIIVLSYVLLSHDSAMIARCDVEKRSVQVNCRMAADSAGRLKELAESAGLPLGAFIERLLDCYQPDSTVIAGSEDWRSVANDLSNRLLALETRLGELEAVGVGTTGAVGKEGQRAAVELNVAINQDTEAFKAAVIECYKKGNHNPSDIAELLFEAGYQTKNGTMRDRSHVSKVIKSAGLKG
jgi:hypothetical protein